MTIGTRRQFQAAIDRARELGGARRAQDTGDGRYLVIGRRGDRYTASVDAAGEWACTCPAGMNAMPCWHQAAAWMKWIAARAAAPTAAPAVPTAARSADPITRRTSGRGIGISPADLGDDDDLPTLAEQLAALGHKAA